MNISQSSIPADAKSLRAIAHTLTPGHFHSALLALLTDPRKVAKFESLVPGLWFYSGGYQGAGKRILRVYSLSSGKRKAVISEINNKGDEQPARPVYRGDWPGSFYAIEKPTLDLCTYGHEFLVRTGHGVNGWAPVPPQVKRHYPALFVTIPPSFQPEDVASKLTGWNSVSTLTEFERCLESAHESVRYHDKDAAPWIVTGHAAQQAHDRERESLVLRIQFYLWLIPLVSPGGVFYVETPAA